jgi:hypothetical protein
MELRLVGYFPKHVVARPEWLEAPDVVDVHSVSVCVSPGPENWVLKWLHNALGFFDTQEAALAAIPAGAPQMTMFAYKVAPIRYDDGKPEEWPWPSIAPAPAPLPPTFRSVGFDAVSKIQDDVLGFECSPLSCNGLAGAWHANPHCLLDSLELATQAARAFSLGGAEPGPYYVFEVLCPAE